ncbi:MAG: coniferyl aldehyde dehydrogenase [Dokdonella sp.]|uniref:coniferyl aldehyde dehydrogenase n=2 Tax=Dokdonella sp. TaxID=2291710 RepID=UPI0025BA61FF|nr:coniferyl aldehyde dehydrogenase [Dokdonella sp.]MBX3699582.1 coniferyl aldehyde dehydrogenase [Dokdonella sp.]
MVAVVAPDSTPVVAAGHDLQALLRAQQQAFARDMQPSREQRLDRLARLERLLDADAEREFAASIAGDFGCRSRVETILAEAVFTRSALRHARRQLKSWMKPRRVPTSPIYWPGRSRLLRQPLGVVGIISPWNYPLQLALAPLVGALAAGNRALLKPSELTPRFSQVLAQRIAAAFAPEEVAVVIGDAEVGKAFAALPFDHLVFTGSTAVGRSVAQAAAKNLTPVTLELGGKSPAIVDASADLALVARRLAFGKLLNAGQTCIAPDYVLVPRALRDEFVAELRRAVAALYPTIHDNPDYTSIINERHYQRLQELLADARARGAQLVELAGDAGGGNALTRKLAPVLLLDVDDSMRVMQEEIFGPLLPVVAVDDAQAALDHVNAHERPLALYWFGRDRAARERVLAGTVAGGVTINDTLLHIAQESLPFGGVGPSGQGHYHGEFGFRQFSKEKPVFIQSRWSGVSLLYPPYGPFTEKMLRILARIS